jgi:uncharacterized iron-regulated membrane protein
MKKVLLAVVGLAIMAFAVYGLITWWEPEFVETVKGLAAPAIFFVGLIVILVGTL